MKIRIIGQEEVRRLLPMSACIEAMAEALATLGRGAGLNPLRSALFLPDGSGLLGMMPAYLASPAGLGIKVVSVFPGNHGTELDSHQGVVLLFEPRQGRLLAVVDASEVTAVRTAAVSGLATRLLAREDANDLAILGSGVQAGTHLRAMAAVRRLARVRVWSRDRANVERFVREHAQTEGLEVPLEAASSARAAVEGADLVCTTTSSREPVLMGEWLSAGAHVNAVGSSIASARELDTPAMVRSRLFVDRRESTLNEAGDFLIAKAEGAVDDSHVVAEIGELLAGAEGRRSDDEVTLFKSLGLGVEDLAAAELVYREAVHQGEGSEVEFSGPISNADESAAH